VTARTRLPAPPWAASPARRWAGLAFVALGVSMIIVDATIVNVALPQVIRNLRITSSDAQWVQEAYTLVFAALLMVWGRLADRHGRRLVFTAGALVFAAASVPAALAPSAAQLIASRVAQGIGGAMMLPSSLSLLNSGFRGRERAIAFAVWGSVIGGTAALGPLLGGWLTTSFSWRWAFGVNVPLAAVVVAGTLATMAESREPAAAGGTDLAGALLSVLWSGGVVFGLIEGRSYGWWARTGPVTFGPVRWDWPLSPVPAAFAVAVLALAAFVVVERRRNAAGAPVLLDLSLFAIRSFRNGNILAAIVSLGEFGLLFSLPLWFQNVRGYSAFETGLALLPLAVGSFLASGLAAQLARRLGPAGAVRAGIAAELAGIAGTGAVLGPVTAWWATVPFLFLYGMGVGVATTQLTGVVLADVPVERSGQGSGTQSTSRQLGSALGIAILGTVLFSVTGARLSAALSAIRSLPEGQRAVIVAAVKQSAGAVISTLAASPATSRAAALARAAFSDGARWAAFTAAAFLALALVVSALASRTRRASPQAGQAPRPAGQAAATPRRRPERG
jgi:EmrB/QacA subfamily drug resistance transporter